MMRSSLTLVRTIARPSSSSSLLSSIVRSTSSSFIIRRSIVRSSSTLSSSSAAAPVVRSHEASLSTFALHANDSVASPIAVDAADVASTTTIVAPVADALPIVSSPSSSAAASLLSSLPLPASSSSSSSSGPTFGPDPDLNSDPLGSDRNLALWLFGCSALVFGMVSLGGLTRLTKSGLSMTEWKPASFVPPRTDAEWCIEFDKYKRTPEFVRVNNDISMDQFQFIYKMEFYHRLLGRSIGIAFALPGLYFLARGRINPRLGGRLALAFVAGGCQGAIGWWMVKSGLENPHKANHSTTVHVSPYRLATHLISAFAIYSLLLSTAMRVYPSTFGSTLHSPSAAHSTIVEFFKQPAVRRIRVIGGITTAVVALTVFSGAFVAGNEAGLIYNEYPLMGGRWIPSDIIDPYLHPVYRNAFENSTMVQWNHRVLATTTVALVGATFVLTRRLPNVPAISAMMKSTPLVGERIVRVQKATVAMVAMVTLQASMGITTLLLHVPISLATLHQAGSLALLSISLVMLHTLRQPATLESMSKVVAKDGPIYASSSSSSSSAVAAARERNIIIRIRSAFDLLMRRRMPTAAVYALMAIFATGVVGTAVAPWLEKKPKKVEIVEKREDMGSIRLVYGSDKRQ